MPREKTGKINRMTLEELRKRHDTVIPFMRTTARVHESGFRCFETGYCEVGGPDEALVSRGSDHVAWMQPLLISCGVRKPIKRKGGKFDGEVMTHALNMDCDIYGRIRFYRGFVWENDLPMSSMMLEYAGDGNDQ